MKSEKCTHERFRWSLLLNEGICIECMAKLTEMPISTTLSSREAEAKTAENILDRLLTGFDWPHWSKKNALNAMQEYAELYSKEAHNKAVQECIEQLNRISRSPGFYLNPYYLEMLEKLKK